MIHYSQNLTSESLLSATFSKCIRIPTLLLIPTMSLAPATLNSHLNASAPCQLVSCFCPNSHRVCYHLVWARAPHSLRVRPRSYWRSIVSWAISNHTSTTPLLSLHSICTRSLLFLEHTRHILSQGPCTCHSSNQNNSVFRHSYVSLLHFLQALRVISLGHTITNLFKTVTFTPILYWHPPSLLLHFLPSTYYFLKQSVFPNILWFGHSLWSPTRI
jgi:hypothetical protein